MFDQFIDLIFHLIFQPGSSLQLIPYINGTIILLIGLLLVAGIQLDIARIHLYILSFFAIGLFFSVNWFYYEFNKIKNQQQQTSDEISTKQQTSPTTAALTSSSSSSSSYNQTGKKNKKGKKEQLGSIRQESFVHKED